MVLTHTTNHSYSHPFPTVTLAYFLRYCSPQLNPFATHVLSTDTISSHVDPATGRLHTTRLHLKKSRMPGAVMRLLPSSITGGGGDKSSFILETSVVDIRDGWMQTESRNLNFTGVLSVVEQQFYTVPASQDAALGVTHMPSSTDVETTVVYRSRLGEKIRGKLSQASSQQAQSQTQSSGWFSSSGWMGALGTRGIQQSIESIASKKTEDQLGKSREGMRIMLERLRQSGLKGVLELRRLAQERAIEVA